jgi:NADH-quinone oxidoreductase subunit A
MRRGWGTPGRRGCWNACAGGLLRWNSRCCGWPDGCLEVAIIRPMAVLAASTLSSFLPIFIVILMALTFALATLVLTHLLGPGRTGEIKGITYESGMNPVGTARKRFNVRFYLIAVVFLVFDVEIIFLYPWAATFANLTPGSDEALLWLGRIMFFLFTTVVAYLYGWRKGVFRFD